MNSNSFQETLDSDDFVVTVELMASQNDGLENFHRYLDEYQSKYQHKPKYPIIAAISVPQSPGGFPTIDPNTVLSEIKSELPDNLDAIAHVSCKDRNRNGLEGHLRDLRRTDVRNLLALTGDMPVDSSPIFELESLSLLRLIADLNAQTINYTSPDELDLVHQFFPGAAVNPYKYTLASAWQQYAKAVKKIHSGANFLITQVGYDTAKSVELIRYLSAHGLTTPVLGNVFLLTKTAVERMYASSCQTQADPQQRSHGLPGTYASKELLEKVSSEWKSRVRGKKAMLERSAQQIAFFRQVGFKGVHIGGFGLTFEDVNRIVEQSQEIYRHQEIGAYQDNIHFPPPISEDFIDSEGEFILPPSVLKLPFKQRIMGLAHNYLVNPDSFAGKVINSADTTGKNTEQEYAGAVPSSLKLRIANRIEHATKGALVNCQSCGDCFLPENYYAICNESACTKGLVNLPCGDSNAVTGFCGHNQSVVCAGELVFEAASTVGKLDHLFQQTNPPKTAELRGTSAVMNYFSGIDHRGRVDGKIPYKKPINLIEIGESLHAQIPRVNWAIHNLIKKDQLNGSLAFLIRVINRQINAGAEFIAINVDDFSAKVRPDLMRKYVGLVSILSKPIGGLPVCIDSSDPVTKQSGLEAYYQTAMDPTVKLPIINSINIIDPEPILNLKKDYDFNVIAMLHDRIDKDGNPKNVETAEEVHQLAREFFCRLLLHDFKPNNIFFDTAVIPIATDIEATSTYKTLNGIKKIMTDPEMSGIHTVIGLSNCSHMMPNRIAVNRAYLEVAMEFGLDTAVLDPTINYGLKPSGKQILGIIRDLAENDDSDPIKGFKIFERIADYSRKYGKAS